MDNWIVTIAGAAFIAIPSVLSLYLQYRRDSIDIASKFQDVLEKEITARKEAMQENNELITRNRALRKDLTKARIEKAKVEKYNRKLKAYIELMGGDIPSEEDTRPRRRND